MNPALPITPRRAHLSRLMAIWRSAGWPCHDAIELELVAAGWAMLRVADSGHPSLVLTSAGIQLLAQARQQNQRCLSAHDRLADRMAKHLMGAGRIVWRELSLRAHVNPALPSTPAATGAEPRAEAPTPNATLWPDVVRPTDRPGQIPDHSPGKRARDDPTHSPQAGHWRMARPDVFSVRRTTVEAYLLPMVHEVKASRADLLSDLRHAAKRESYQWLSCETYYVLPAGVAEPSEIPESFGLWWLHGPIDTGTLQLVRPARHSPCKLPFAVWMALANATPVRDDGEPAQPDLDDVAGADGSVTALPNADLAPGGAGIE